MIRYSIIIISLLLTSCSQDEPSKSELSISACAKQMSDGSVVECEPNQKVQSSLKNAHEFYEKLNQENPGPSFPGFDDQHKVVKATRYGMFKLENGELITFVGLECDHEDLTRVFKGTQKTEIQVVYIPSGVLVHGVQPAYIWGVSNYPKSSGIDFPFSTFSPTNETAISSGWCRPSGHVNHAYAERYEKIALYFNPSSNKSLQPTANASAE